MPDTRGFETVAELSVAALRQIMRAAWKSGGDIGDPGVIPEFFDIPPGTAIGPYVVADGQVQIPQSELDAAMAPAINGVSLRFGLAIQVEVQDPPVPSASLLDMHATVDARAPVGTIGATNNVGILLDAASFPRGNVSVVLDSGDPIEPLLDTLVGEFVHLRYEQDGTVFPHTVSRVNEPILVFGIQAYTVDVWVDLYDDPTAVARQIETSRPTPTQVRISVPIHLKVYNIRRNSTLAPTLDDPMGVLTRLVITAPFDNVSGAYAAHLESATVTVDPLTPSPIGNEGTNYTSNKARVPTLDTMLSDQLRQQGQTLATAIGLVSLPSPTVAQIETAVGDMFHPRLAAKQTISVWTPEVSGSSPIQVNDVTVRALPDALAIALNAGANADASALTSFIPVGRDFAVGLAGAKVLAIIDETIHRPESDGGFGPNFPPKRFTNVDGHDADLTSLTVSLRTGAIRMEGDITVIDAVAGSIDVDASFTEDVGLLWETNADGSQRIASDPGPPDVDLSLLAWIVSFLIGFITLGLVGGIIAIVILIIVENVAERIGGTLIRDQITNQVTGIGAWPEELIRIGRVQARFENPIDIDSDGIAVSGTMVVSSTAALTAVVPADAQGPYTIAGSTPAQLAAGALHPDATYHWRSGDGATGTAPMLTHRYGNDGIYVAKLTEVINQPGGARSRHFAEVRVRDDAPQVDAGPDRIVNEGDVVGFTAPFTDPQWLDRHEATWDWGDNSRPDAGMISETNSKPQAVGTVGGSHAWCDNGTYEVTLTLRDDGGGLTVDTVTVTVLNVPPTVETLAEIFAYPCTVLTLESHFDDPGWCDTHTGTWDFGDCTPPQTAVIVEEHERPAATGTATTSHIYQECGTYRAICTVIDDDGGLGSATTIVRVVDVANAGFEGGFRTRIEGASANEWEPYGGGATEHASAGTGTLVAEELLVHGGQRSQRIQGHGSATRGVQQAIGANPGWEYQVSVWYSLAEGSTGVARLGVDPFGGMEATSPDVVWAGGADRENWRQLAVRVAARTNSITIFLEVTSDLEGWLDGCFDDVSLVAIQTICPPTPEPPKERECVSLSELAPAGELSETAEVQGFAFIANDGAPLHIVDWGDPAGQSKLELRSGGLTIQLPGPCDQVRITVFQTGFPVGAVARDGAGSEVAHGHGPKATGIYSIEFLAQGMVEVELIRPVESLLVSICARPDRRPPRDDRPPEPTDEDERPEPGLDNVGSRRLRRRAGSQ